MQTTEPLIAYLIQCVVRIECDGAFKGTGFFVGHGLVLTCAHSVAGAQRINIITEDGLSLPAVVAAGMEMGRHEQDAYLQPDAALLEVSDAPIGHACVRLASEHPAIGTDRLILAAYSRGENDPNEIARSGAVLYLESLFQQKGATLYKFSQGQVVRGFSGGPVLNMRTGRVCALVDSSRSVKADLGGFGVPISLVETIAPSLLATNARYHEVDRRWTRAQRSQNRNLALRANDERFVEHVGAEERRVMLRRVYNKWVRDVLPNASANAVRVQLFVQRRTRPIDRIAAEPATSESLLGYLEDSGDALVLLGGPGAGKTTLLITLTQEVIELAEQDRTVPIPVLLNLSSWRLGHPPLEDWVVAQLQEVYGVPRSTASRWMSHNSLLLLFDGLDELGHLEAEKCVSEIRRFQQDNGPSRIVIGCQEAIYDSLGVQLPGDVIEIKPLSHQEVVDACRAAGNARAVSLLGKVQDVFGPVESPLMLNVVLQASGTNREIVLDGPMSERQVTGRLLDAYVERMLQRRKGTYGRHETLRWLSSLAVWMRERGLSEFQLDRVSPRWVLKSSQTWIAAVIMAFVVGVPVGIIDGIGYGLVHGRQRGIGNGIVIGALFALFVGLRAYEIHRPSKSRRWRRLWVSLAGGCVLTVLAAFALGPRAVVVFGPFFILAYLVFANFASLAPVEQVRWNPRSSVRGFALGLLVGAPIGVVNGVRGGHSDMSVLVGFGIGFGLSVAIFGAIAMGLRPALVNARIRPNEGTYRSAKRAAMFIIACTVLGILAFGVPFTILAKDTISLGSSIRLATVLGMGVGLLGGGMNTIEHVTVRLLMALSGRAPLNYTRFLNEAAERLLLYRAGSGYLFMHGSLLTHFCIVAEAGGVPQSLTREANTPPASLSSD